MQSLQSADQTSTSKEAKGKKCDTKTSQEEKACELFNHLTEEQHVHLLLESQQDVQTV
jgi:hypothetical protein